jgi:hypothetical protein
MMDISLQVTQATLGMDQLYRDQNRGKGVLDREGLVPVILTDSTPTKFANWDDANVHLLDLAKRAMQITDALRRNYLNEMIDSLRGLIATFRGDQQNYLERVERCLRVSADPVSQDMMDGYRGETDRLLNQLGYARGTLTERLARWEADHQVPTDQVPAVLTELLNEAKRRTDEKIFPLLDLTMKPVGVRGVPFAAYCGYLERELRINLDFAYTRPALKHLACHEAFPGHTVHLAVREERTKNRMMPLDGALVVTSSASSPLFEGIGDNGIRFLDWIEDSNDLLAMTLNRLRAAARLNAARMIHHENKPLDQVKTYLQETCFVPATWAESRLAFLTHSLRAPFIYAYWCGDVAVEKVWERVAPNQRKIFFEYLYYNMHTPTTLDRYWKNSQNQKP